MHDKWNISWVQKVCWVICALCSQHTATHYRRVCHRYRQLITDWQFKHWNFVCHVLFTENEGIIEIPMFWLTMPCRKEKKMLRIFNGHMKALFLYSWKPLIHHHQWTTIDMDILKQCERNVIVWCMLCFPCITLKTLLHSK